MRASELRTDDAEGKARRRRNLVIALCLAGCAVAIAWGFWKHDRRSLSAMVTPPKVDLTGSDPQIAAAIDRAKAAVAQDPSSGSAWATLGGVLMTHKFHAEGIVCFAEAEKRQPKEPRWPYFQGVILLSWQPDAAIPKLARTVELTGDNPPAPTWRLVNALLERGRLDEAERSLRRLWQRQPDDPHALLGLGKLELGRGHLEEALRYLEQAAAKPETTRAAMALIAGVQQRLGNTLAAEEVSARVARLPRDPLMVDPFLAEIGSLQTGMQAWLTRADRLLKNDQRAEGFALLKRAVATYPNEPTPWRLLGQARLDERDYGQAEAALRKALELAPDEGETHFQLGTAFFGQNRIEAAAECFRRAIELRANYAPAHYNLGHCFLRLEKHAEAAASFERATRFDPTFADAFRQLGAARALGGKYKEAIPPLERAIELNAADEVAAQMLTRARALASEPR